MVALLLSVVSYAAQWFVYKKMGREGWEGIVPIYNLYVLFEFLYGNGWSFLKVLIPIYGIYVIIKCYIDLAHRFNKSTAFGWGLLFLPFIFFCIIAFSKDIKCEGVDIEIDPLNDVVNTVRNTNANNNANNAPKESDADILIKYKELFNQGVIDEEEFKKIKERILKI